MRIGRVVLTLFCLIIISCVDNKSSNESTETKTKIQKNVITAKAIENFKYTDYALSPKAEEAVINWEKYQEIANQIGYLKKADLSFFNSEKELLNTTIDEFTATVPEQLRTNPILSRTVIIKTTLLKLNESLRLDNIEDSLKLNNIKDVLVAFANLNYQINKKLEFDIYDKIRPE